MNAVLVVDKPSGPTSHDVVQVVRRALKVKKAGHTGTLDPLATGVLPICLDDATKVAQFITDGDKSYDAVLKLGVSTDTLDAQGKVLEERAVPPLTTAGVESVLQRFRGTFQQTPPMFSAVKVGGRRLYELAREGTEVERAAREVTVHSLVLTDLSATSLTLSVKATKGFFVRSLAAEVGEALGCGAHLTALRRTSSGIFSLAQAVPLAELTQNPEAAARRALPISQALADLPELHVNQAEADRVRHGGVVEVARPDELVRVVAPSGELLAIAQVDHGRLRYRRVLV